MSNVKHIVIASSAVLAMGLASVSLASNCPTTISPATATCLSSAADAKFQKNYALEYAKQKAGMNGAFYNPSSHSNNSRYSQSYYSEPKVKQASSYDTSSNNQPSKKKPAIRWF